MLTRLEPEVGDVVTVAVRHHGRLETFLNVTVATVPTRDRFTFFVTGKLFEASPDAIVAFNGIAARRAPPLGEVRPAGPWPRT